MTNFYGPVRHVMKVSPNRLLREVLVSRCQYLRDVHHSPDVLQHCSFLWRALHKDVTKNTFIILPTCSHFTVNRLFVKIQTVIVTLRRGKLAFTRAGPPQREGLFPHQPFSRTCSFSPKHERRRPPEGPRPLWGWQLEDAALRTPADTLTSAVDTADTEYSTTKTPPHNGTSEK